VDEIRVLVVTDQDVVRDDMRYGFADDVEVFFAADAREAWRSLPDGAPSVVVVDLQTGSAGGYGLARDMRETSTWRDVPIIMLMERDQDAWLARKAGARIARTKPVSAARIEADIRSLVGNASAPK
jgi:DNA-binding response OmpR family regulator